MGKEKTKKKKFKDTKLGSWLKDKAPVILNQVGEFLPDSGTLGIVKKGIEILGPKDLEEGLKEVEKVERKITEIDLENMRIDLEESKIELENNRLELANLQRASETYEKDNELQKNIAKNLMWTYVIQSSIVIIGLCIMSYLKIPLSDFILVLITTIVNNTGQRYGSVIDFFFGGSLGAVKDGIKKIVPPKKQGK